MMRSCLIKPELHYINLDRCFERRENVERQCSKFNLTPIRHRAIESQQIEYTPCNTKEEAACLLSHLSTHINIVRQKRCNWVLVAEDDVQLLGNPDWGAVIRSAPRNAELLQLCTMTSRAYDKGNPLWVPIKNGYYNIALYLIKTTAIKRCFRELRIGYNLVPYLKKSLPLVKGAYMVADSYLFYMYKSYTCNYCFAICDTNLGSTIHESHLPMHKNAWSSVLQQVEKNPNPFFKGTNNDNN